MVAVGSETGFAASNNVEECAVTKTLLFGQEIDLCGSVGGTNCLDIHLLFAGERRLCERRADLGYCDVQVDKTCAVRIERITHTVQIKPYRIVY